ncbi:MAG: 2-phospho-L-lactate guanylyltransferase [Actinobacteria bacterium]|nr:2-phospho-L-lactate guanylyltransferase [Actinomycetota bacterium]
MKRLAIAKRRLMPHVTDQERLVIATALLADALDLCSSVQVLEWWVITDDPTVESLATSRGFKVGHDPGTGLNDALLAGITECMDDGAASVTIIPTDVPLAWSGDVQDILDTGATSDVVVVPSRDGGTNALYLSPGDALRPAFGEFSFTRHLAEAEHRGLRCSMLSLPRLELDIDTIEDVDLYLARPKAASCRTSTVLAEIRDRAARS